jgi:hypothetical protein
LPMFLLYVTCFDRYVKRGSKKICHEMVTFFMIQKGILK